MGEITRARREELSLGNLIFCAMVLLLHLCSDAVLTAPTGTLFYVCVFALWKLCSAAVYGFLFLGGLKACLGRRQPLKTYYLRRARSVLLPYLVWAVIYYFVRLFLGNGTFSAVQLLKQLALGETAAHLYFVIAIVQFYALIPLWRAMVDHLPAQIVLPILAVLSAVVPDMAAWAWEALLPGTPVLLDRCFISYLFVWCAGCYAGAQYERFTAALRQSRWFLWVTAVVLLPLYLYVFYRNQVDLAWYAFMAPLQQLYCAVAIGAVMALAQAAGQRAMRLWTLRALDRASYQIYLSHMLPLLAAPGLMRRAGIPDLAWLRLTVQAAIVLIPTLGGCLIWQLIVQKRAGRRL